MPDALIRPVEPPIREAVRRPPVQPVATAERLLGNVQVYSFRPACDPELLLHFGITDLEKAIRANPDKCQDIISPIDPDYVQVCVQRQGVERPYLERRLTEILEGKVDWLLTHLILCEYYDGTHVLADGHHRMVALAALGLPSFRAWTVPAEVWEPCLLNHPMLDDKCDVR